MPRKTIQPHRSRTRRQSSVSWLRRHLNDPYTQRARDEGYRARSVFKLQEIDRRFKLFRPSMHVVDLGAAPGSWSQYAGALNCKVVAVDLETIDPIGQSVSLLRGDFLNSAIQNEVTALMEFKIDLILSDMAASSTGQRAVDRLRAEALGEAVLEFAEQHLRVGGDLLVKLLKGSEAPVMAQAKSLFGSARLIKPDATRSESSEIYLLARDRRPKAEIEA
ncbi:MAG: RlmE family RNA methyltransferase [Pseudomonadota bacterium]